MRTALQQSHHIQEMATKLREGVRVAQERLDKGSFFVSKEGASKLKIDGWVVAGLAGVASVASVAMAAPIAAVVVGVAVAASAGTAGVILEATAMRREQQLRSAQQFLKAAAEIKSELHSFYRDVQEEISKAQSVTQAYTPSADLVEAQAQHVRAAQSATQRTQQTQTQTQSSGLSVRRDSGPRLS